MSFLNLFNKSPKKETNQEKAASAKPWMDNPLASQEMQKKRYDAAMEFLQAFQEKMPLVNGTPHPGTTLSIVSRLAGTNFFRAVNGNKVFQPGTVILSEEINQAYPQLLNLFALYCKQNGVDVMAKPLVANFPENDKPLMQLDQVQAEYQEKFNEIMKKHGLDYLEGARAGMVVCSIDLPIPLCAFQGYRSVCCNRYRGDGGSGRRPKTAFSIACWFPPQSRDQSWQVRFFFPHGRT